MLGNARRTQQGQTIGASLFRIRQTKRSAASPKNQRFGVTNRVDLTL